MSSNIPSNTRSGKTIMSWRATQGQGYIPVVTVGSMVICEGCRPLHNIYPPCPLLRTTWSPLPPPSGLPAHHHLPAVALRPLPSLAAHVPTSVTRTTRLVPPPPVPLPSPSFPLLCHLSAAIPTPVPAFPPPHPPPYCSRSSVPPTYPPYHRFTNKKLNHPQIKNIITH